MKTTDALELARQAIERAHATDHRGYREIENDCLDEAIRLSFEAISLASRALGILDTCPGQGPNREASRDLEYQARTINDRASRRIWSAIAAIELH